MTIKSSAKVDKYASDYGLTQMEVYMAMLLACGCSAEESYAVSFRMPGSGTSQRSVALKYVSRKPAIDRFVNVLKGKVKGIALENLDEKNYSVDPDKVWDKEEIIASLQAELTNAKPGKERSDILMKIADLQQVKKEEDASTEDKVLYFLPQRCDTCPFKQRDEIAHGKVE